MIKNNPPPRFIYLTGCDGTGKSTQTKLLVNLLQSRGVKTRQLWMRFQFFFSLPLLVYARISGLSRRKEIDGVVYGAWNFQNSWLMKKVFPWILLIDAAMFSVWKVYIPLLLKNTIVCERYVLDSLVDLAIATRDDQIFKRPIGVLFRKLIPTGNAIINLDLDQETLKNRRIDLQKDIEIENKLRIFRNMSKDLSLAIVSSKDPISDVQKNILQIIGLT